MGRRECRRRCKAADGELDDGARARSEQRVLSETDVHHRRPILCSLVMEHHEIQTEWGFIDDGGRVGTKPIEEKEERPVAAKRQRGQHDGVVEAACDVGGTEGPGDHL